MICRDGKVEEGRELARIGSHVKGYNRTSIGICIIGRLLFTEVEVMTAEQSESLMALLYHLKEMYPSAKIHGHYELDKHKTCPNLCMTKLLREFAKFQPMGKRVIKT